MLLKLFLKMEMADSHLFPQIYDLFHFKISFIILEYFNYVSILNSAQYERMNGLLPSMVPLLYRTAVLMAWLVSLPCTPTALYLGIMSI